MTPGAAFHYAAAIGAPETPHKKGVEKAFEKSTGKPVPPHTALEATGAYRGFLPGKFFPKKVYLLEINVNK
jgi:hypothetical protein